MKLVVGLGNPGKEYVNTRHNIGYDFIDNYISYKKIDSNWINKFDGCYLSCMINKEKVFFFKSLKYMNNSGESIKKIIDYYNIDINDILIISDDLDLNIGNFKLKSGGSCGGHNGLRSIEKSIMSSNYKRLKIGISNKKELDTKDYVLGKMSIEDRKKIVSLFNTLNNVLDDYFCMEFEKLMNKYNQKNK